MVKAFGWSLYEIDETDVTSLARFLGRLGAPADAQAPAAYCDQVDWM